MTCDTIDRYTSGYGSHTGRTSEDASAYASLYDRSAHLAKRNAYLRNHTILRFEAADDASARTQRPKPSKATLRRMS